MEIKKLIFDTPLEEANPILKIETKQQALSVIGNYAVKIGNHKPNITTNIHNYRNGCALIGELLRDINFAFHKESGDYEKEEFENKLNLLEAIWYDLKK